MTSSTARMGYEYAVPKVPFGSIGTRARRASAPRGVFGTLVAWQSRAEERHHLRTLDDRLLADMGMTPIDAVRESRKPFWRA